MIRNLETSSEGLAAKLASVKVGDASLDMSKAAEESCRVVGEAGFYPLSRKLDADYVERYSPVMEQRLAMAGARLAKMLNQILK